jgi:hypothetical protein
MMIVDDFNELNGFNDFLPCSYSKGNVFKGTSRGTEINGRFVSIEEDCRTSVLSLVGLSGSAGFGLDFSLAQPQAKDGESAGYHWRCAVGSAQLQCFFGPAVAAFGVAVSAGTQRGRL